ACLEHLAGVGHPESPDRLRAVMEALEAEPFRSLQRAEAPRASKEAIARVHPASYIAQVEAAAPSSGVVHLDADTLMTPGSLEAAYRAAGAVVAAVDAVVDGRASNAFCAVRPPGHHAEPQRPTGFCIFNNVAVGTLHARAVHGIERIAVVDFDVHHGNGTEAMFWEDRNLVYVSTHQSPLYPGTGDAASRGVGNIFNAPLPPFAGSKALRAVYGEALLPALEAFKPELVMISAGFDAHKNDPLANLELVEDDYAWLTRELVQLAGRHAGGRLVSTLEGGYNLQALAASAARHVTALMAA
ncbi:MAG TPA: histone deacetylase family protein, partial [Alphaproteobacteria bacterium]|nr:histone deacetylase family protein [Alphaproteobacteria bacterium]